MNCLRSLLASISSLLGFARIFQNTIYFRHLHFCVIDISLDFSQSDTAIRQSTVSKRIWNPSSLSSPDFLNPWQTGVDIPQTHRHLYLPTFLSIPRLLQRVVEIDEVSFYPPSIDRLPRAESRNSGVASTLP